MTNGNDRENHLVQADDMVEHQIISSAEGWIFLAGCALVVIYFAVIGATWIRRPVLGRKLLLMTSSHVFGGRAAGMSTGYAQRFPQWAVILANAVIETFMVLLIYPLFVFSYKKLLVIKPLENTFARTRRAAQQMESRVVRYGIPGLFLFVWFPFWMTGPVVGCIIGFLIGLRPLVNLAVVLGGTYVAIVCYGLLLKPVHDALREIGPYVPFVFVGIILFFSIAIHIRHLFGETDEEEGNEEGRMSDEEG